MQSKESKHEALNNKKQPTPKKEVAYT